MNKVKTRKILFGVFLTAFLMLVMPNVSAVNVEINKQNQENFVIETTTSSCKVGVLIIGYEYEVIVETVSDFTKDLGRAGGDLRVEVELHFCLDGLFDYGEAKLKINDNTVKSKNRDYSDDFESWSYVVKDLEPGEEIKVTLWGHYEDNTPLVGSEMTRSDDVNIKIKYYEPIKPKLDYSPKCYLGDVDTQHWSVSFNVKNAADSEEELDWYIIILDANPGIFGNEGDLRISPDDGYLGGLESKKVTVTYNLEKECRKTHQDWKVRLKLCSDTTDEQKEICINFGTPHKSKSRELKLFNGDLFNLFMSKFSWFFDQLGYK